jgi:nitrite reductase/ring-hydroxylating ferredoxin subunit
MDSDLSDVAIPLCLTTDIAEGDAKGFLPSPSATRKVIVLKRNGQFHAWLDACPHYEGGTPMAWKSNAYINGDGTYLSCHSHGALFNMETGECVLGPCLGQALTRVELTIKDTGEVFIASCPGGENK